MLSLVRRVGLRPNLCVAIVLPNRSDSVMICISLCENLIEKGRAISTPIILNLYPLLSSSLLYCEPSGERPTIQIGRITWS